MRRLAIWVLLVLVAWSMPSAQGGLFEDIYRGLELVVTPSGAPIIGTADGFRVNGQRRGRLRILPDSAGQGYTLEFDRSFGLDSAGRPEVLDLGMYELELSGNTSATFGYTKRGMLIGNGDLVFNNLTYSLRGKTGAQDFDLRGTLGVSSSLELNQLGFYTLKMDVSNTNSALIVDGVLANDDDTDVNFDIGPISIDGNIYADAFMMIAGALGMDIAPLEQMFPGSPVDRLLQPIQAELENTAALIAGLQLDGDDQLPPAPNVAELSAPSILSSQAITNLDGDKANSNLVPEPGTLLLIGLGGLLLLGKWRR